MRPPTRFYDPASGLDGPVSGALVVMTVHFDTAPGASASISRRIDLPAGMSFMVTDVKAFVGTVTGSPTLQVGDTAGGVEVVAAAALSTGLNTMTVADGTIAAGGLIDVTITTGAGEEVVAPSSVSIAGYVTAPPTSVVPNP